MTNKKDPKIVKYSNFSRNLLGTAYPKLQILSSKEENGLIKYYLYLGKTLSGWYTKEQAKVKFGIDL